VPQLHLRLSLCTRQSSNGFSSRSLRSSRPKNVDEISHQEHVVATLKTSIANGQLPHLLFYGPPGTGKTSTIVAVGRQLFGPDFRKNGRFLELNASDDRGIKVVREKVKSFAQGAISTANGLPPFKIIVLDEADSMTGDAQSALRRMMENYSKVTRFCLICNYVSRIIEPVASRCAKFRFAPLERGSMASRVRFIASEEHVNVPEPVLESLLECSNGRAPSSSAETKSCLMTTSSQSLVSPLRSCCSSFGSRWRPTALRR